MPITPARRQELRLQRQLQTRYRFRPNAFILFRQSVWQVVRMIDQFDQAEISAIAAQVWQTMSAKEKAFFEVETALTAEIHNSRSSFDRPQDLGQSLEMRTEWVGGVFFLIKISPK